MAIQKYQDSFLDVMPTGFSTLLDRFFKDTVATRGQWTSFSPKADTYATDNCYDIEAALPGLNPEEMHVSFETGRFTISGERKLENERKERNYYLIESSYGSFKRSFQLPATADPRTINASFDNGVLHVHVPKNGHKPSQRQLLIHSERSAHAPAGS